MKNRTLLIKPNITTRGFILINENEELIRRIESIAAATIQGKLKDANANFNDIKSAITSDIFPFI